MHNSNFLHYFAPRNNKHTDMLTYSSKTINRNFKIKVTGTIGETKINTLVGVSGFLAYVNNDELAGRLLDRAFGCPEDKCVCRLRRGLVFSFYAN